MTEQQFAYWLNGFAELTGDTPPTAEQWKSIREHLATVFVKMTPPVERKEVEPSKSILDWAKLNPQPAVSWPLGVDRTLVTC